MTKRHLLATIFVISLVVLAGCSGVLTPTAGTTGTPTADADSPTATTTAGSTPNSPNGSIHVHYLNVGQGASTLVIGPSNETMLIDTGDWRDDGEYVLSYLQERGIDRVDYLVTTHADADHIGGHAAVISHLETEGDGVGAVYDPGIASTSQTYDAYLDAIEAHNVTLYEARAGDRIPMEGVNTSILAPPEGYLANGDANENSLVLSLRYDGMGMLLPGDIEADGEGYLVEQYDAALNASVLKVAHHGSRSSSTTAFLDAVQTRLAVISSGYDSQYGHPHEAVLERLSERSIRTYWTATHGSIRVSTNGSTVTVATQSTAPTAPMALRDGTANDAPATAPLEQRVVIDPTGETSTPIAADGGTTVTPTPEPTTTDSSSAGAGSLAVATIHEDAAGDEYDNLNDEYIVFENTGEDTLDLSGWTVQDAADHTYTFPSEFALDPGAQVTLRTGSGSDSASELYWGAEAPVWNNDGDTIIVADENGTIVLEEEY